MGNALGGGRKTAKVMKINGEILRFKTPVQAGDVVKDYPNHVLLESEAVKHFGVRAKPLELGQLLKPKRLYFLVELPKFPEEKGIGTRRVRSGIHMSAKDRLESMMLARRSASDLSLLKPTHIELDEERKMDAGEAPVRLKLRLPKAEVERLMLESKDEAEAAEKIMQLCTANNSNNNNRGGAGGAPPDKASGGYNHKGSALRQQVHWNGDHGRLGVGAEGFKAREKRVGFLPVNEGEIQLAVA